MRVAAGRGLAWVALLGLLLAPVRTFGVDADGAIADGGQFFSPEALSEAGDIIRSIQSLYDRDVRVETYPEVPPHLRGDLERDGREKFYDDWLNRRARQMNVQGVFVLVTRTPARVQVGVDKATGRRAFPVDDREALRDALAAAFHNGRYDQGLLDGLRFVKQRLDENTSRDRSGSVPVVGDWN